MNSTRKSNNHFNQQTWEGPQIPPSTSIAMNDQEIKQNRQEVFDFLNNHAGIASRLKTIFAFHYDQIQREVLQELSTCNNPTKNLLFDFIVEYMEESMTWPEPDNQKSFNREISAIYLNQ